MTTSMPIISVSDVEPVLEFYQDKLNFNVQFKMTDDATGKLHTISLELNGCPIMFTAAGEPASGSRGLVLYFPTDDVDAYHDAVIANGDVHVIEELTDQFWGDRTFMVLDPLGIALQFATTTENYQDTPEGMSVEMLQPVGS